MKYLVILVVVVLFYAWLRGQRRVHRTPPRQPPLPAPQDTVACARCGVHVPRTEALSVGTKSYCCTAHQREDGP